MLRTSDRRPSRRASRARHRSHATDMPRDDYGANRAGQSSAPCTPPGLRSQAPKQEQPVKQASKRSGKKTRNGRSSKPLQPANRG